MTISGIRGSLASRILSREAKGAATRLVEIPVGWGTSQAGAFTGDVELFVLSGMALIGGKVRFRIRTGAEPLGPLTYTVLRAHAPVGGIEIVEPMRALLFTSGPVRYQPVDEAPSGPPEIFGTGERKWQRQRDGRAVSSITPPGHGPSLWLSAALDWRHEGSWHRHPAPHDWFLIEGDMTVTDRWEESSRATTYRSGGYAYRPAGWDHAGQDSGSAGFALAVCRTPGERPDDW